MKEVGRRYIVRGRVQGVGFRYFVQAAARKLGVTGFARNLDDGSVEVVAVGDESKISELAGLLHRGPRFAEVRTVEESEVPAQRYTSFDVEQ